MRKLGMSLAAVIVPMLPWIEPAGAADGDWKVTEQHVIMFKGGIPADLADRVAKNGGRVVRQHQEIGVAIATGLSEEGAAAVAGNARVARDLSVQLLPALEEMDWSIEDLGDAKPLAHDPAAAVLFPLQWNMRIIHADDAWAAGFEGGSEIRVAILDSGIDPFHFDLAGLVDPLDSAAFVPALTGPPDWVDDNFHGTHVAGIVVTNGIGTSGVAPHTSLVAVKVCDALGSCSFAAIIAGILHATNVGVDVINLSLGGTFPKSAPGGGTLVAALNSAVNYANRHGVLVVSGSGNDAADLQHNGSLIATPCESGAGLCVSASGPDDFLASYSNYGTSAIDVAAPGGDSVAAGNLVDSMVLGPCTTRSILPAFAACAANLHYILVEGTSQAAPHVSGAAALLEAQSNGALSAAKLKTALQRTADDLGQPGTDSHYGKGRLNVCSLLGC